MLRGLLMGVIVAGAVLVAAAQFLPTVDLSLPAPDAGSVAVPAGSEFSKERPDTEPVLPSIEGRPVDEPGQLISPVTETEGVTVDTSPAEAPATGAAEDVMTVPEDNGATPTITATPEASLDTGGITLPSTPSLESAPVAPEDLTTPDTSAAESLVSPTPSEDAPEPVEIASDETVESTSAPAPESPDTSTAPDVGTAPDAPETDTEVAGMPAPETEESPAGAVPTAPDSSGFVQPEISTPSISGEEDALPNIGETPEILEVTGPAIESYAAPFEPANDNPRMAIVLFDNGTIIDVSVLADLPLPVGVAVDPNGLGVRDRMTAHRDAGTEILVLTPLPQGASPADIEVSFQAFLRAVPQAVAVLDTPGAGLQASRPVAAQVAEILSPAGLGMITYNKGLNSGVQIAEGANVPVALVHRDFSDSAGDEAAIKRMLDQGAFRAGQAGAVIMVGILEPATLAALSDWSGGNRAESVLLAPVSATLLGR